LSVQLLSPSVLHWTDNRYNGRLIAIHAYSRKKKYHPNCEPLPKEPTPEYGDNWGISIQKFLEYKSSFPSGLMSNLRTENVISKPDPTNTPTPTPTKTTCPPFIGIGETCNS
ncbi:MAG: hypothetical protein ACIWVG_10025, partial [Gloeotrichia echinulata HAB0833]